MFTVIRQASVLLLVLFLHPSSHVQAGEPAGTALTADRSVIEYDREMRMLAAREKVRRALAQIDREDPASTAQLIELTQIPAPPFAEEARARRFAELARALQVGVVETDEAGNVYVRRPGRGPDRIPGEEGYTIAMAAHLDTVFPAGTDVTVRREGQRLLAPGIADNARGLVLLLLLMSAIEVADLHTAADLLFVATVGEEGLGDLRGVKHLLRDGGPRIDEFIAIDGGSDERVLNQAIGSLRYRLTFRGPGGHSWGAFGLGNPAHALASAIHHFDLAAADFVRSAPRTTYNVGRIGGGTSVNAVPFENWAEIDMRSESPAALLTIDELLHAAVATALDDHNAQRDRGDRLTVEIRRIGDRPSGIVDPRTPLIQRAMAAARFFGIEPLLSSGSTDANVPIARGIPATTISRGGKSGGAHALDEWWSPEDSARGVKKALLLLLASAGVTDG